MSAQKTPVTAPLFLQLLFFIVVIPFLPLLISSQWDWWEAWIYALVSILAFVFSRILAARRNPDIIAERARFMQHENTTSWDKVFVLLLGVGNGLVLIGAGIDMCLNWPPAFSLTVIIVSLIILILGYVLSSYALIENRFFSGTVRIQAEPWHHVVSGGPYHWMHHPGYAGGILAYLATPIFLDSYWAILLTILIVSVLIIRTTLEDRYLQENLTGYRDYASRVHFRLVPWVW